MPTDRLDDVRAAFESLEEPEGESGATPEPAAPEPAPEAVEAAEAAETPPPAVEGEARARDASGRFARAEGEKPQAKPPTVRPQGKPSTTEPPKPVEPVATETPKPAAPVQSQTKAPQSWKPAAREKWAALPPEVQAEAVRIDREVRQVMQESAGARKQLEQLQQATAPYENILRANGIDPLTAISGSLQAAAQFNSPNPEHVAGFLAQMLRTAVARHGEAFIDRFAATYDKAGGAPQAPQHQPQQPPDIQGLVRQQISEMVNGAAVQKFLDSEPEFLDDVMPQVVKLLEAGLSPNVEDAYNKAIALDPSLSGIVAQRKAAEKARANPQSGSTQKARAAAAASIKAAHAPGVTEAAKQNGATNRRQDLEAAWEELAGR